MISLLITIIVIVLVVAVVFWLVDALPIPHPFNLVIKVVIVLVALLMILQRSGIVYAEEFHMHGLKRADADWYDGSCCSRNDCRQTGFREVERRVDGWFVHTTGELIPFDDNRIRFSRDPLIHICLITSHAEMTPKLEARCLYIPDPGI